MTIPARARLRFGTSAACGCLVAGLFVATGGGCTVVDPHADYQRAAEAISSRSAVDEVYDPSAETALPPKINALLEGGLSVDEAVQLALLNNPQLQASFAQIGVARADLEQSRLLSNPSLALGLQLPEGGGVADVTVALAQQIADFWQIPVRRQAAEADLEAAILSVGAEAVQLAGMVRERCYRVLAAREAVRWSEENLRLADRNVELTRAQAEAGELSAFEVDLTRGGAVDARGELIMARGQLAEAQADLLETLGLGTQLDEIRLEGELPGASGIAGEPGAWLARALDQRFDMRVAYLAMQRAEAQLQLECRRFLPDVQIGFAFERNERRGQQGRKILADTARESLRAGQLTAPAIASRGERALADSAVIDAKLGPTLALTLPIFDQNQAQIARAQAQVLQARKDYARRAEAVAAEVRRSVAAAKASGELLVFLQQEGVPQATDTVRDAEQRFAAGEESVLALIEAQDALVRRRQSLVDALRDQAVAMAQLEQAVGGRLSGQAPQAGRTDAGEISR